MNTSLSPALAANRRANVVSANVALGALVLVAALVHSYNMFQYPQYIGDEGIYMAQAYAVLKLNAITPYAYWYDHAPLGWILIAAWTMLTGGFYSFGTALDGGRVLMLVLHLVSVALVFRITLRITASAVAALGAGLLYTLSPLSVIYGRMVLLDNIMAFWVLLALALLLRNDGKIWQMLYSGLCLGVAVLTKETAIVFLPALIYGIFALSNPSHARFARAGWLFFALSTISLYFLYAALRGELIDLSFAPSPLVGGDGPITLVGALLWQTGRSGGVPWDMSSDFYRTLTSYWLVQDPWILGLGLAATGWNLFGDHRRRLLALMSLMAVVGVARGGVVHNFYILPLLPFLAINAALAIEGMARRLNVPGALTGTLALAVALTGLQLNRQPEIFRVSLTSIQREALGWVREHVPPQAQIVADDDMWVDLREGPAGQPSYPGAHSHWKVANDPAVHKGLFDDNWHNLDYLILTPDMAEIFERDAGKLTNEAYLNSTEVARFTVGANEVQIRKVNHPGIAVKATLENSYRSFRDRFIRDGQVRAARGYTDARDQAGAMLMAVWMDDRATFDQLWQFADRYLRGDQGLLLASNEPGASPLTMTEADTDAALALLLAERRWGDASYGRDGRALVRAIWEHAVVDINGAPYVAAGSWAIAEDRVIVAPAALSPAAYHLFAEVDPGHNWWWALAHSYDVLERVTADPLGGPRSAALPPAYVGVSRESGELLPNPPGLPVLGNAFNDYAAQTFWRVGLDAQWHDDRRADDYLLRSRLLRSEWSARGGLATAYAHDGRPQSEDESLVMYAGALAKFLTEDPQAAHELYAAKLATSFSQKENEGQWADGASIAQQRWAWLATGLYADALEYHWEGGE